MNPVLVGAVMLVMNRFGEPSSGLTRTGVTIGMPRKGTSQTTARLDAPLPMVAWPVCRVAGTLIDDTIPGMD